MLQFTTVSNGKSVRPSSSASLSSSARNGMAPRTAYWASWTALFIVSGVTTLKLGSRGVGGTMVRTEEVEKGWERREGAVRQAVFLRRLAEAIDLAGLLAESRLVWRAVAGILRVGRGRGERRRGIA
jgi:hypothetical protein